MLEYILLGMLYSGRSTGYDLKKRIESGIGVFYRASYGSIYPTLTRLAEQGLVASAQEPQGARIKMIYEITPKGKQTFFSWLEDPETMRDGNNRGHLVKIYFFDALPGETAKEQLLAYEVNCGRYLRRLTALARAFESGDCQRDHYYKLSTLYYGIGTVRETLRWCRFIREKRPMQDFIQDFIKEETEHEPDAE